MTRTVWAFAELPELDGQTGFVMVDDDVAEKLLKSGDVQDPYLTEALHHIGEGPGKRSRYMTRQMKAGEGSPPPKEPEPPKADDDDKPKRGRPPKGK